MRKKKQPDTSPILEGEFLPAGQLSPVLGDNSKQENRAFCVLLFLEATISYRSIPRVLELIYTYHSNTLVPIAKCPHVTSIINWVLTFGLGLLNQVKPIESPWIAIIDHAIGKGSQKVFVVLRIRLDRLAQLGKAPGLEDCECIGIVISPKVNGEIVAADLDRIFAKSGNPTFIVKDGDASLNKGSRIWQAQLGEPVGMIYDIGHAIACIHKAEFDKDDEFKRFRTLAGQGNKLMRQSSIAHFCSPGIRDKARFQNLRVQAEWGETVIQDLKREPLCEGRDSDIQKLHKAMPGFCELEGFLGRFLNTVRTGDQVMKVLKNEGLTKETYERCKVLTQTLPDSSQTRVGLLKWLENHQGLLEQAGGMPLMVSSDVIESGFGKLKNVFDRGCQGDVNRSVLLIPTFFGQQTREKIMDTLEGVRHIDLIKWVKDNVPTTIFQKNAKKTGSVLKPLNWFRYR